MELAERRHQRQRTLQGRLQESIGRDQGKGLCNAGPNRSLLPPEDSQFEVANMLDAKLLPVPSIWGHFAGGPGTNPADGKFIDDALKQLLSA